MLIVGAKGFAKEVLEIFVAKQATENLAFYDDISIGMPDKLFDKYPILKSKDEVQLHFNNYGNDFTIGIGNPLLRIQLIEKIENYGGNLVSTVSPKSTIGSYEVKIGTGSNILDFATISNSVTIGKAALIYYHCVITHDCQIGDYVEISPCAVILGRVTIGNFTTIGANATILPDIKIGNNVTIGAGAVVTQDIQDNCVAVGVPAKVIKFKENE